ncbi:MAG: rhodanese-like domain-containing protein [Nitrospirales bacterium]|nr:rhodanese-like domain-containing protein [Nitrospirales bacterium]
MMKSTLIIGLLFLAFLNMTPTLLAGTEPYILQVQQLKEGLDKTTRPDQKGFILVDVRSPEEHQGGFIPGTDFNIDFRDMQARHQELHAKLDDHIVVYCQSGHRSNIAAETLMQLGYQYVYNVEGSMNAWEEAGYTVQHPR